MNEEKKHLTFDEMMAAMNHNTRKRPADEEHRIQCACVRWFNVQYPKLHGRLFAVPNGGRRDATTAAKLKAEGVVPGVADLVLLISNRDYGALLIEMKTPKGRQSDSQKKWEKAAKENDLIIASGSLYMIGDMRKIIVKSKVNKN